MKIVKTRAGGEDYGNNDRRKTRDVKEKSISNMGEEGDEENVSI